MIANALGCLIIVSGICIHDAETVRIVDHGVSENAVIINSDYKIEILLRSDNKKKPAWAKLNPACRENKCLAYFKYCSMEKDKTTCSYYFGPPGADEAKSVTITSTYTSEIMKAENNIGALLGSGLSSSEIRFSQFSILSDTNQLPYCGHRLPQDKWC